MSTEPDDYIKPIPDPSDSVLALLQAGEIIPDVIPHEYVLGFKPSVFFSIAFPGFTTSATEITLGTTFELGAVQKEPELEVVATTPDQLEGSVDPDKRSYTVVMTDPDAPSKLDPKMAQWRHWVVTGVKLPKAGSGNTFAAKPQPAATPFHPPAPPAGSGPHRYVVLLFEEPASFSLPADALERQADVKHRAHWHAMKFAEQYKLKLVGANFFITQKD